MADEKRYAIVFWVNEHGMLNVRHCADPDVTRHFNGTAPFEDAILGLLGEIFEVPDWPVWLFDVIHDGIARHGVGFTFAIDMEGHICMTQSEPASRLPVPVPERASVPEAARVH